MTCELLSPPESNKQSDLKQPLNCCSSLVYVCALGLGKEPSPAPFITVLGIEQPYNNRVGTKEPQV